LVLVDVELGRSSGLQLLLGFVVGRCGGVVGAGFGIAVLWVHLLGGGRQVELVVDADGGQPFGFEQVFEIDRGVVSETAFGAGFEVLAGSRCLAGVVLAVLSRMVSGVSRLPALLLGFDA
jgi:hypothetical protein